MKNRKMLRTHLAAGPKRAYYRKLVPARVVGLPFVKERLDVVRSTEEEDDVFSQGEDHPEPFASFS